MERAGDDTGGLALESLYVGGQPLVSRYLERLRVREFLDRALGPVDPRAKLAPVDTTILLLRNLVLSRHPLYSVGEWLRRFDPEPLGHQSSQLRLVNDDRLGKTLDKLFRIDRRTVATRPPSGSSPQRASTTSRAARFESPSLSWQPPSRHSSKRKSKRRTSGVQAT